MIARNNQELLRWQGTPVADIQYQSFAARVLVILEDDFFSALLAGNMIGSEPFTWQGDVVFSFISRADVEYCKKNGLCRNALIGTQNPDYSEMYLRSRGSAPPLWRPGWDRDYPPIL